MYFRTLISLLLFCNALHAEKLQLNILYEEISNPPYALSSGKSTPLANPGITVEVLKKIASNLNLEVHFQRKSWIQGMRLLEHGRIDGLFHGSFKKERLNVARYPLLDGKLDRSRRLMTQSYYLYGHTNNNFDWSGNNLDQFQQTIGAPLGYSIVGDLQKAGVDVLETKQLLQAMLMLKSRRLGAVASLEHTGDALLDQFPEQLKGITKHYPALKEKDYFLLLSRQFVDKHPLIAEAIWDEVRRIRSSGEWDKISKKYQ